MNNYKPANNGHVNELVRGETFRNEILKIGIGSDIPSISNLELLHRTCSLFPLPNLDDTLPRTQETYLDSTTSRVSTSSSSIFRPPSLISKRNLAPYGQVDLQSVENKFSNFDYKSKDHFHSQAVTVLKGSTEDFPPCSIDDWFTCIDLFKDILTETEIDCFKTLITNLRGEPLNFFTARIQLSDDYIHQLFPKEYLKEMLKYGRNELLRVIYWATIACWAFPLTAHHHKDAHWIASHFSKHSVIAKAFSNTKYLNFLVFYINILMTLMQVTSLKNKKTQFNLVASYLERKGDRHSSGGGKGIVVKCMYIIWDKLVGRDTDE